MPFLQETKFETEQKTLFSYGQVNEDFTLYITPSTISSSIGISMLGDQTSSNTVGYVVNEPILCYASLQLHNYRLVTQLTTYNINDITQVQNKYHEYTHGNLQYRSNQAEIGFETDTFIYHSELIRGVMSDDEQNTKIASLIDAWKTSNSNITNPNDVDVDIYDQFGENVEPTVETFDSAYIDDLVT